MRRLRVPAGASLDVRVVDETSRSFDVVRGVVEPFHSTSDSGAMLTVRVPGGIGYAATAALSVEALQDAANRAHRWALACAKSGLLADVDIPAPGGPALRHRSPARAALPDDEALTALLVRESDALRRDPRIVHSAASLRVTAAVHRLHSNGDLVAEQAFTFVEPNLEATASDGSRSQTRTLAGKYNGFCQQGGFEVIERSGLIGAGGRIADEALELLAAPDCPQGRMSLLLMPDQMMLQIHESIGHPLELDRILGDERNFAGTSFVTPGMFGHYRYGSELLDVSFDPGVDAEFGGYAVDDEGSPARRVRLIERGILVRPLGGALSRARARAAGFELSGAASARASGWYRPPIDRMANLNVEPGETSLERMIASVERGVMMRTNASWSIDDSRNKFQFGCEWGRMIENGRLTTVVRNPNYRGVSATFWRSLAAVGDAASVEVMGTPYCGKGEPGQIVRVGHASPPCLFHDVDVFGAGD